MKGIEATMGLTEAKLRVAEEMGHSRPGITEWYLGKTVQAVSRKES